MTDKEFDRLLEKTVREHGEEYFVTPQGEEHSFTKEYDRRILSLAEKPGKKKTGRIIRLVAGVGAVAAAAAVALAVVGTGMIQSWTSSPVPVEQTAENNAVSESSMETDDMKDNAAASEVSRTESAAQSKAQTAENKSESIKKESSIAESRSEERGGADASAEDSAADSASAVENHTGEAGDGKLSEDKAEIGNGIIRDYSREPETGAISQTENAGDAFEAQVPTEEASSQESEFDFSNNQKTIRNNGAAIADNNTIPESSGQDIEKADGFEVTADRNAAAVVGGQEIILSDEQTEWLVSEADKIISDDDLVVEKAFITEQIKQFGKDGVFAMVSFDEEFNGYTVVTILSDEKEGYIIAEGSGRYSCFMIPGASGFYQNLQKKLSASEGE